MISYKAFEKDYKDHGVEVLVEMEQAFRKYSEAILLWLKEKHLFVVRNQKTIEAEVLYAFPNLAQALKGAQSVIPDGQYQKPLSEKLVDLRENRAHLPIVSFYLQDIKYAWARQLPGDIRYGSTITDGAHVHSVRSQKDRPYDLTYIFNFWTKYKADMNYLWQQFLHDFAPFFYFEIDDQLIPLRIDMIQDTSSLESKDGAEQIYRWDITCSMDGWLKTNKTKVPTVQMERLIISETSVDLDTHEVSFNAKTGIVV